MAIHHVEEFFESGTVLATLRQDGCVIGLGVGIVRGFGEVICVKR